MLNRRIPVFFIGLENLLVNLANNNNFSKFHKGERDKTIVCEKPRRLLYNNQTVTIKIEDKNTFRKQLVIKSSTLPFHT